MEILREALITVKTTFENKGPYKLQISKRDLIVSTIKIRMKDEITNVVSLSEGEYVVKILKSDKECLSTTMHLPNFENGSLIKITANDTLIEANTKEVIKYKTVDEFMESMKEDDKKSKKTNKTKVKQLNLVGINNKSDLNVKDRAININKSSNKNQMVIPTIKEVTNEIKDDKSKVVENKINNLENRSIQNKSQDIFITREEFDKTIFELTNKYDNQIRELTQKLEKLQNTIEPSTNINIKLDDI